MASAFRNALTIDVEDYFQVAALAPAAPRSAWSSFENRVERNVGVLLDLFARKHVHATFFVLGWVAERSPALVRRIVDAGHEIASHGYSHELIYTQSPETFRQETVRCKAHLEDVTGRNVRGYRAASFSITARSLWALDTLIDLGFEYDSSIFPIRHDRYGLADANPAPSRIRAPSGRELVEFPMSVAPWPGGLRLPVSGGGYFRLLPYTLTRTGLRRIQRNAGRPFVFYLHPWEIDPEQPRLQAGWLSTFRHYTNLSRCEARLERLLDEFEFDSMSSVLSALGLLATPANSTDPELAHA
jgi:polysaccharide deacetylase family protein (PEP-CTERM system associated)